MVGIFRKIAALLSRRELVRLGMLFIAVVVTAFMQMVSMGAVLPFLAVAAAPDAIQSHRWLSWAYKTFDFTGPQNFLVALGFLVFLALVLSNAWMTVVVWAQQRFTRTLNYNLSLRLLRHYAEQPYVFFLGRNSASLGKNILNEVDHVTGDVILPALQLATGALVATAIFAFLLAFDPMLALLVGSILCAAYSVVFLAVRRRLSRLGMQRVATNAARFKAVNELFGAIKDVKLLGREIQFVRDFAEPSRGYNRSRATAAIIALAPKHLLEAVAFGSLLLIAIYLLTRGGAVQEIIPILGLYAFAGYRLMPSLHQVLNALTRLRFGAAALDNLHRDLAEVRLGDDGAGGQRSAPSKPRQREDLPLATRLELDRITFSYPGAPGPTLADVSLAIDARTTVGFMGPTGAGKTTLIDIILGLLRADRGEIRIDGTKLTESNLRAWQRNIGYVPQHIYLSDDSIARNIAFGLPDSEINMAAVERAAAIASIDGFINEDLPRGYGTIVGERGVRLSGGQRQRVGIARALYHGPSVLVLDEATSALDSATEIAVMQALQKLAGKRTILIIAHRPTTLRECHKIYFVRDGAVAQVERELSPDRDAMSYLGEVQQG